MGGKKQKTKADPNSKKREEILRRFKKRRILNLISTLIIFGMAFFAFWYSNNRSSIQDDMRPVIVITICTCSLGALVFSIFNWRCPSCGKHLGGTIDPASCRKCGFRFR